MNEKKIVVEFAGCMDTAVISKWLEMDQGYEVIAAYYNYGQSEDLAEMKKKALLSGASKFCVIDLESQIIENRAIDLVQQELTSLAKVEGANCVAFTQTKAGVGTEQLMQEIAPELRMIEPFEKCGILSKDDQFEYLKKHHVPVGVMKKEKELRNDFSAFCDWHKRRDVNWVNY